MGNVNHSGRLVASVVVIAKLVQLGYLKPRKRYKPNVILKAVEFLKTDLSQQPGHGPRSGASHRARGRAVREEIDVAKAQVEETKQCALTEQAEAKQNRAEAERLIAENTEKQRALDAKTAKFKSGFRTLGSRLIVGACCAGSSPKAPMQARHSFRLSSGKQRAMHQNADRTSAPAPSGL